MDEGMMDWTAVLTDEPWFLPDPSPAGTELAAALPTSAETWPSLNDLTCCPWLPNPPVDCCWRRARDDPFVGVEESVAGFGHFGVGFPDGYFPETVPGSFTITNLELGSSPYVVDTTFLDRVWNPGSDDGCSPDTTGAKASQDDKDQSEQSLAITDHAEFSQESPEISNATREYSDKIAMVTSKTGDEDAMNRAAISDADTWTPDAATAAACPSSITSNQCARYLNAATQETAKRPSDENYDEIDGLAGPPAKITPRPRKYQRKRKFKELDNSSGITKTEKDDSDSDYAPDHRKKKRARIPTSTVYTTPPTTAKKPRRLKGKQVWYATNSASAAKKSRINTKKSARDQEAGVTAVANYANNANTARFAGIAKRARYALEATTIRPQPGMQYEGPEEARYAFYELQEEFEREKLKGTGSNRNVSQVVFAERAGDAMFAEYATSAEMIIKIG